MRGPPVLDPIIKKVYLKTGLKSEKKSPNIQGQNWFHEQRKYV